ncbi:roadblock/LC7 domain-containing protein [Methanopyrus sp.]
MELDDVVKEHGVLCAFVATEDGFVVDATHDTDIDPEESAALAATAVMRLKNVMNRLIGESEEEMEIIAVCGHSLALKEVEGGLIVGLLYDSNEVPTGIVKLILQELEEEYRGRSVEELL